MRRLTTSTQGNDRGSKLIGETVAPASSVGAVIVAIFPVSDSTQDEVGMPAGMVASTIVPPSLLCSVFRPACRCKAPEMVGSKVDMILCCA